MNKVILILPNQVYENYYSNTSSNVSKSDPHPLKRFVLFVLMKAL